MQEDELLFREFRRDYLYHDGEQTRFAGAHRTAQYWVYQGGALRGVIPFSMVDYQEHGQYFHYATIPEGLLDHAFFTDRRRRPLPFLDPRQSYWRNSFALVYISPQFSFEAAKPKPRT